VELPELQLKKNAFDVLTEDNQMPDLQCRQVVLESTILVVGQSNCMSALAENRTIQVVS
jgi:hypothetical protein